VLERAGWFGRREVLHGYKRMRRDRSMQTGERAAVRDARSLQHDVLFRRSLLRYRLCRWVELLRGRRHVHAEEGVRRGLRRQQRMRVARRLRRWRVLQSRLRRNVRSVRWRRRPGHLCDDQRYPTWEEEVRHGCRRVRGNVRRNEPDRLRLPWFGRELRRRVRRREVPWMRRKGRLRATRPMREVSRLRDRDQVPRQVRGRQGLHHWLPLRRQQLRVGFVVHPRPQRVDGARRHDQLRSVSLRQCNGPLRSGVRKRHRLLARQHLQLGPNVWTRARFQR
jgi:hypothetical protein